MEFSENLEILVRFGPLLRVARLFCIFESGGPSEIRNFDDPIFVHEKILHFEIAVADLASLVEEGNTFYDLFEYQSGVGFRESGTSF